MKLIDRLRALYRGDDEETRRFHLALAAFDLATIIFLIASSFYQGSPAVEAMDAVIGVAILIELAARIAASRSPRREFFSPFTIADVIVVASLLAPILGEGFAFLRILRLLRLLNAYKLFRKTRPAGGYFARNDRTIVAATHLAIFLFVSTAVVYESQRRINDQIANYVDAFYYTVTTLTTTGYGDITLKGHAGRLLAAALMIIGVSLFLRLIHAALRPNKVEFKCPDCGLKDHDIDAVHCKTCGRILNIEDEGAV
ncbi:MAG: two pore domain potassium channel family protein [Parvularculaceae bacterium]|nr:two pore domain potassium channel family protein [Parvularculaceae bacterium]